MKAIPLGPAGLRKAEGLWTFGRPLAEAPSPDLRPDWAQAEPAWIKRALDGSQRLPSGGWYVVDARNAIGKRPRAVRVNNYPLVVWREGARLHAAPEPCPHMGASLAGACVREGQLLCPWHGLRLGISGYGRWRHLPTYDDGLLMWVQLDDGSEPTAAPTVPERPAHGVDAVIRVEAQCAPVDVLQNRLDPWHGAHFHPYAFARLRVIDQRQNEITVRVAYRLVGRLAVEVDARFHCTDPRTIVMTIVGGEGAGSVVETHATPLRPGRTAIVEATVATSDRPGFVWARRARALIRPAIRWAARRLWTDDAAYAERLYAIRNE